jgi:hypothetical protein
MLIQPKITRGNVSSGESGVEALAAKRNEEWTISPALNFTVTERDGGNQAGDRGDRGLFDGLSHTSAAYFAILADGK